jgi:glyoxylase-like metal-dependent hydrolase (beta-lactamase superfamily II)
LIEYAKTIHKGDDSGNEMTVRWRLPSGLEIVGLPTRNAYGGHWDLGPTWNYAVLADTPFLVDSGRFGQGSQLIAMMEGVGINAQDLEFVLISHGHEDHDGGLAELVNGTHLSVKAHAVYDYLIKTYPAQAPGGEKNDFPAKCWHCPMPESFYTQNCLGYHQVLQGLKVDPVGDGETEIGSDVRSYHLPGHSPDCLAVLLGEEAIIVGDIILPDISPWPTRQSLFKEVADVVKPVYTEAAAIFGLCRYIKSENRVNELLQHHVKRCGAIISILNRGPKTAEQIAAEHFEERLLEGFGNIMAANEIVSHCELLIESEDIVAVDGNAYAATGRMQFETFINNLTWD